MNTIKRLRVLLEERDLSLYQLAQMSGVSYNTLRATDKREGQLSVDTISLICNALNIKLPEFFSDSTICYNAIRSQDVKIAQDVVRKGGGHHECQCESVCGG